MLSVIHEMDLSLKYTYDCNATKSIDATKSSTSLTTKYTNSKQWTVCIFLSQRKQSTYIIHSSQQIVIHASQNRSSVWNTPSLEKKNCYMPRWWQKKKDIPQYQVHYIVRFHKTLIYINLETYVSSITIHTHWAKRMVLKATSCTEKKIPRTRYT